MLLKTFGLFRVLVSAAVCIGRLLIAVHAAGTAHATDRIRLGFGIGNGNDSGGSKCVDFVRRVGSNADTNAYCTAIVLGILLMDRGPGVPTGFDMFQTPTAHVNFSTKLYIT